jgi:hypothetical protein
MEIKEVIIIKSKINWQTASKFISKAIPYIILCIGIFLISLGTAMVYMPAGFITLGVLLITALLAIDFK